MCASQHAKSFPSKYTKLLYHEGPNAYPKLASLLADESVFQKAMVGTTTAVDVIFGGVKVNALPELVTTQVNFRIDFSETVESTQKHVSAILAKVAKKNGLHFRGFGKGDKEEVLVGRYVKVELLGLPLEPAPRTPCEGGVWDLFAGTVK